MKKIQQLVIVAALLFAPLMVSQLASAQVNCEISNTGSDSENECTVDEEFTCEIDNENNVIIRNSNGQEVASGNVELDDNGSFGGAVSGSASNNSEASFNVEVTNGNSCVATVVPEAPVTPETPETPTPGRGESTPVTPANEATPAALPVTSGSTAPAIFFAGGIAVTAAIAFAYRRYL